ncbi:MAG TPA: RodZ domain-containing protein [Thermoanaerobaculia bacterium]|nr:RodZ domain-containing protein [Thermoanaerobaculia bacterium]
MPPPVEPRSRGAKSSLDGTPSAPAPPIDRPADGDPASFGIWLRRQREAREVGLREIADRTKISLRYLEALEENRFALLPAPVFARGFLREYARYVGLNPDEVVNHFLAAQGLEGKEGSAGADGAISSGPTVSLSRSSSSAGWKRVLFFALATTVVLGLVALAAWFADQRRAHPAEPPASEATNPPAGPATPGNAASTGPAPQPAPAPVVPAVPARALRLTLDFTGDCWIDAVMDGGERHVSEKRVQGETVQLDADRTIELTLGSSGAVDGRLNGLTLPLPRRSGEVVRRTIDLDTLRQLQSEKESH